MPKNIEINKVSEIVLPIGEHPYQIPSNWCWVRMEDLYQINPKNNADDSINASFIPMEKIEGGLKSNYSYDIQEWGKAKKSHTQFADGDVAFAKISPCFENRKSMIINGLVNGIGAGTTELIVLRQPKISQKFTFWLISNEEFISGGKSTYSGTVGQQRISMEYVRNYPVPLPPLAEQERIVDRIECWFAKLDEARDSAERAIDSFETRKKAILEKAFSGKYTEEWRRKQGKTIEEWSRCKIKDVCIPRAGFAFDSHKFKESGIQIIRMGNLYGGKLDLSRSPVFYDSKDVNKNIIERALVQSGDILITLTGTKYKRDYGYAVCIENDADLLVNQRILCFTPTEKVNKNYILYYMRSESFRDVFFSNETGGVNQGNVSSKFVENIEIMLPSIEEQNEIATILQNVLAKEEQAKDECEQVIEAIDSIKKSILAKAFRGELGTNDPSEECSIELLKQIIANE